MLGLALMFACGGGEADLRPWPAGPVARDSGLATSTWT